MTLDQYTLDVISYISQNPNCTQQAVADALDLPLVVIAAIVVNLADIGLVEKTR